MLLGFGASAVYPYLSYEVLADLIRTGEVLGDLDEVFKYYRKGISKGLLKILSKMGISTIASYRGAQLFEAVGLAEEVVGLSFKGVASRIKGARFVDLENDQKLLAAEAWSARKPIQQGGLLSSSTAASTTPTTRMWSTPCKQQCRRATTPSSRNTPHWSTSVRCR